MPTSIIHATTLGDALFLLRHSVSTWIESMPMADDNREALIKETLRQTETMLESQLTIALAADARALTFCGILLAAASLLVGLAANSPYAVGMYCAAVGLCFAAGLAGYVARPVRWMNPGQKSSDFANDLAANRLFIEVLQEMSTLNDTYISKNNVILDQNGKWVWRSAIVAVLSLPVATIIQFLTCYFA